MRLSHRMRTRFDRQLIIAIFSLVLKAVRAAGRRCWTHGIAFETPPTTPFWPDVSGRAIVEALSCGATIALGWRAAAYRQRLIACLRGQAGCDTLHEEDRRAFAHLFKAPQMQRIGEAGSEKQPQELGRDLERVVALARELAAARQEIERLKASAAAASEQADAARAAQTSLKEQQASLQAQKDTAVRERERAEALVRELGSAREEIRNGLRLV